MRGQRPRPLAVGPRAFRPVIRAREEGLQAIAMRSKQLMAAAAGAMAQQAALRALPPEPRVLQPRLQNGSEMLVDWPTTNRPRTHLGAVMTVELALQTRT